jgi:hypothetical protein
MKARGKRGRTRQVHSNDSDDDIIMEETEPPMPKDLPKAAEFIANKSLLYARIDYRVERSDYYLKQWREGTLNVADLAMNTEHGTNFSMPK